MATLFVMQGRDKGKRFDLRGRAHARPRRQQSHSAQRQRNLPPSRRNSQRRSEAICSSIWPAPTAPSSTPSRSPSGGWPTATAFSSAARCCCSPTPTSAAAAPLAHEVDIVGAPRRRRLADREIGQPRSGQPAAFRRSGRQPLAGRRPQQFADHVSHGPGRQPHARHRPAPGPHHGPDLRLGRSRPRLHHARRSRNRRARRPPSAAAARHRSRRANSPSAGRFSTTSWSAKKAC